MSNKVKRSIFYWLGMLVYGIACINIYGIVGEFSNYLIINLLLIYISGGVVFIVTVGTGRKVQEFFGHDLKKECECPPTKPSSLPHIKKNKDI